MFPEGSGRGHEKSPESIIIFPLDLNNGLENQTPHNMNFKVSHLQLIYSNTLHHLQPVTLALGTQWLWGSGAPTALQAGDARPSPSHVKLCRDPRCCHQRAGQAGAAGKGCSHPALGSLELGAQPTVGSSQGRLFIWRQIPRKVILSLRPPPPRASAAPVILKVCAILVF